MPKFLVFKSVDAFQNYSARVETENAAEAREIAEADDYNLDWTEDSVSTFDETDYDNIEPQEVADDFTLEPAEDLTAELLAALKDIFEHCALVHKRWGDNSNSKEARLAEERAQAIIAKAERR